MGKVTALLVIAFSAMVNAEDPLTVVLVNRASNNNIEYDVIEDMDEATLAKPAKAGGATKAKTAPAPRKGSGVALKGTVSSRKGTFTPIQRQSTAPKRVFGGTNKLMAGNGMAIQEDAARPSYWGGKVSDKGIGYGWTVGSRKINQATKAAPAPAKKFTVSGKFTPIAKRDTAPKRLFGGTNKLMAGNGQAIQDDPATPSYWGGKKSEKGLGYGWFQRKEKVKAKALPEVQTAPFLAHPVAPRLGAPNPQITMGGRPFLLENSSEGFGLSNFVFFVAALSMLSLVLGKLATALRPVSSSDM